MKKNYYKSVKQHNDVLIQLLVAYGIDYLNDEQYLKYLVERKAKPPEKSNDLNTSAPSWTVEFK